ncbi:hypothetical protein B0A49_09092 [Cryomyces minteri]|uniref:PCI domain-containing protein n=1 Tax=Cryomyces minteri TaxID=331657 RepID=A0A4U0WJT8_9PEZI|nr:hypothetical protein B0A49_09092 [Cryomyces minteri]
MEQTRALNALEPFVALSKSANSTRAAVDLVTQAISAPNTYVFAELLQTPNIQALRQVQEVAGYLTLLEIFAWGTWQDYSGRISLSPDFPRLTPPQELKLRLLSLLTLAARNSPTSPTLTYDHLKHALDLPSARKLEDLVISAIYRDLLTATLDTRRRTVSVSSVAPLRDVSPGALPVMQDELAAWSSRCEGALEQLEKQIFAIKQQAAMRSRKKQVEDRLVETGLRLKEESEGALKKKSRPRVGDALTAGDERNKRAAMELGSGYEDDEDLMDVDDVGVGRGAGRGAKRGGSVGNGGSRNALGGLGRKLG